jgi:uncharacterized protein (TIGR03790 family)
LVVSLATSAAIGGGGPENVLLVVNANSDASKTVANHYMRWRQIPPSNVVYINWKWQVRDTNANIFRSDILQPVLDAIKERNLGLQIDYVVYSCDFPWLVDMRAEFEKKKLPASFKPVASLTGATYLWQFVQLKHPGVVSPASNWYVPKSPQFNQAACVQIGAATSRAFRFHYSWDSSGRRTNNPQQGQRYLMSMMLGVTDGRGNTVDEILAYLHRSIGADATRPSGTFYFMKQNGPRSTPRHDCYAEVVTRLRQLGFGAEVLEGDVPKNRSDVLGIMAGVANFNLDQSGSRILPGAVCDHLTSLGGDLRPNASQTALTEFLRHGAAGSCGAVFEPYNVQAKFPLPSLPLHYARGCSLAEAFYQSISGPYQLLLVGDPLCQPWAVPPSVTLKGLAKDEEVSGTVALEPSLTPAPGRSARFFETYVDGVMHARVRPDKTVPLDTTKLADGYHELRVVGVDSQAIETQGRVIVPFTVSNSGNQLELTAEPTGDLSKGATLTLTAAQSGAERITFLSNGRVLETVEGSPATASVTSEMLGRGPIQLQAKSEGASPAASKTVLLNVR